MFGLYDDDYDLYNGYKIRAANSNPPSVEDLQLQGMRLNQRLNDTYDADFAGFDYLKTKYPRFADKIQLLRQQGINDERIDDVISRKVLPKLNFIANKDRVNQFLGRTPESMQEIADYEFSRRTKLLKKAFPDKSDDDIFNAIGLAQYSGIDASAFLDDPKLIKAVTNGIQLRESIFESAKRGASNYLTNNDMGAQGVQFILGNISKDELFKKREELAKKIIPEPAVQTFGNKLTSGMASISTQGWKNLGAGYITGKVTGAALGGLGYILGGPVVGAKVASISNAMGFYAANAWELFEDQAGNDVADLLQMTDENGQPLSENVARVTACITGAVTVATELSLLKYIASVIPGGDALMSFAGLNKEAVIDTVRSNPIVRDSFEKIVLDTAKGVGVSTINNIIEAINTDLKIPLVQAFSSQPFPKVDWNAQRKKIWNDVKNTTASSIRDFTGSALFSLPLKLGKWYHNDVVPYKQTLRELSQQSGIPEAQIEHEFALALKEAQEANNRELEQKKSSQLENNENKNEFPVEQNQQQEQQEQKEQKQIKTNNDPQFVFMPKSMFDEFLSEHNELGDLKAFNVDDEVGMPFEQFSAIKEQFPDFINSIVDDLRYDTDGKTVNEGLRKINATDKTQADIFHSEEVQNKIQKTTQAWINAGLPEDYAKDIGEITGVIDTVIQAKEGKPLPETEVRTFEQLENQYSDMSRLNPDYDINNPATWTNQERAQRFIEASQQINLSNTERYIKGFLDTLRGHGIYFFDYQTDSEGNIDAQSSMSQQLRDELNDYSRTIRTANLDTLAAWTEKQNLDDPPLDVNAKFPEGMKRNPTQSYSESHFGGKTKVDFAVKGNDLFARLKISGKGNLFSFAIRDFRNADFLSAIAPLFDGQTAHGVKLSETPAAQFLLQSLESFWKEQGLNTLKVHSPEIEMMEAPNTYSPEIEPINAPDTHSFNQEKPIVQTHSAAQDSVEQVQVHHDGIDDVVDVQTQHPQIDTTFENPNVVHPDIEMPTKLKTHKPESIFDERTASHVPIGEFLAGDSLTSKMSPQARYHLAHDLAMWRNTVEDLLTDPKLNSQSKELAPVLRFTPQVLTLVGAKNLPVYMNKSKIFTIMKDHPGLFANLSQEQIADVIAQIPEALTDPVAIFKSKSQGNHDALVILTDLKDTNNASINAAFHLEYDVKDNLVVNKLATFFGREKKVRSKNQWTPDNKWFRTNVNEGNLLYINTDKANQWGAPLSPQEQLLQPGETTNAKTQQDLYNLWNLHRNEGYYYTDSEGRKIAQSYMKYGKAIVQLLTNSAHSNMAVPVHELGHSLFNTMYGLAQTDSIQMKKDFQNILDHAGVTQEQWDADSKSEKGGAREKAHEWFAKAFEVYVYEGRVPNKQLQGCFERIRKFLLDVYSNITQQLGVEIDDEIRDIFDRLLTMENDNTTISEAAVNDSRAEQQVDIYQQKNREIAQELQQNLLTLEQERLSYNTDTVVTPSGTPVDVQYKLVDVDDLIVSHNLNGQANPNYPQELQPRNRKNNASMFWVEQISKKINPRLLGENPEASHGAPIIGNDLVVESGNGRTLALSKAYLDGHAERYKQWLRENLANFGINPDDIDNFKKPVLVRERISKINRAVFAAEANVSSVASMSEAEHAFNDARKISNNILAQLDTNKSFTNNQDFVSKVIGLLPESERGDLIQSNGDISSAGYNRVLNALIALAYDSKPIMERLSERVNDDIRNIGSALIQAAPKIAYLEKVINNPDFSIAKDIVQAVNTFINFSNQNTATSMLDYLTQPSLFDTDNLSDNALKLVQFMADNKNSPKRIAYALMNYADLATNEGNSAQGNLFTDDKPTREQLLDSAIKQAQDTEGNLSVQREEAMRKKQLPREVQIQREKSIKQIEKDYQRKLEKIEKAHAKREAKLEDEYQKKIERLENENQSIREQKQQDTLQANKDINTVFLAAADELLQQDSEHQQQIQQLQDQQRDDAGAIFASAVNLLTDQQLDYEQQLQEQKEKDELKLKQQLQAQKEKDKLKLKERLEQERQKAKQSKQEAIKKENEKADKKLAQQKESLFKRIDKLKAKATKKSKIYQDRINNIKAWQNSKSQKQSIRNMVKGIFRMSKSNGISYSSLQEIQKILEGYNLSRKEHEKRDLIRSFLDADNIPELPSQEQLQQDFEAQMEEAGITQQDIDDFFDKINIEDMSIHDVKFLYENVKQIFNNGRREFAVWQQEINSRCTDMANKLGEAVVSKTKKPQPRVPKSESDLIAKSIWDFPKSYWDSVQTPGRFLQGLGEDFRAIFDDGFSQRRGEAYSFIHKRELNMLNHFKQLGLSITDFMDNAISMDGINYSWGEVMGVYLGMKNEKHSQAVLWGDFVNNLADSNKPYNTEQEGMNAINKILNLINQPENSKYKQAAELIIQDFDDNFDRINQARINDFNKGMNHEDNYTPIFRLKHQTPQGLIDNMAEDLAANGKHELLMKKVADNFTISRQTISPLNQPPIALDVVSNWFQAMNQQEFNAALGGYATDVMSAMFKRGNHGVLADLIKERYGLSKWNTLCSIYNDSIVDSDSTEFQAADTISGKVANFFMRGRSIAYTALNPISILSQFSSYFLALPYTSRGHLFRSLLKALDIGQKGNIKQFLESVYEKAPELRYTGGDPIEQNITRGLKYQSAAIKNDTLRHGVNLARRGLSEVLFKGQAVLDNWTKSIVFDAVYNSEIEKGAEHQHAVDMALRAVHDTQPGSTSREQPRVLRNRGFFKFYLTQFMNALAPVFNMGVVDIAHNLADRNWNSVKAAAWNALAVGLTIAFAGGIKDAFNGRLPSGKENDDGTTDNFWRWLANTGIEGLINSAPILNGALVNAYRYARGMKTYRSEDRLLEPFKNLYKGLRNWNKRDEDKPRVDIQATLRGLAMIGFPIPYGAIEPVLRFFGDDDDE